MTQIATDNAVSALGKIIDSQNQPQLVAAWLNYMPLRGDRNESKEVLKHLLKLMATKPMVVLGGEGMTNIAFVIRALISYLQLPKVATEEEITTTRNLLKKVCCAVS